MSPRIQPDYTAAIKRFDSLLRPPNECQAVSLGNLPTLQRIFELD